MDSSEIVLAVKKSFTIIGLLAFLNKAMNPFQLFCTFARPGDITLRIVAIYMDNVAQKSGKVGDAGEVGQIDCIFHQSSQLDAIF